MVKLFATEKAVDVAREAGQVHGGYGYIEEFPVARFYRELGLKSVSIYIDKSANVTYAVKAVGMPTTLLIDAQGRELGRVIGPAEWDGAAMVSRLTSYLEANDRGSADRHTD